ncbi:MAG: hypothetical protein ACKOPE_14580 [Novosphingobium sp.]
MSDIEQGELRSQIRELGAYLMRLADDTENSELAVAAAAIPLLPPAYPLPNRETRYRVDDLIKLARLAKSEYLERERRALFVDREMLGEPGWDILLDLFVSRANGLRISVTSACIAARVPPTTALRWLAVLEDSGLVERTADQGDRRRDWVSLTASGLQAMADYFRDKGKLIARSNEIGFGGSFPLPRRP